MFKKLYQHSDGLKEIALQILKTYAIKVCSYSLLLVWGYKALKYALNNNYELSYFNVFIVLTILLIPCEIINAINNLSRLPFNSTNNLNVKKGNETNAFHEAGHVCVARILDVPVKRVDIISNDSVGGKTELVMPNILKTSEIKKLVMIEYGGFMAEKCLIGEVSNGSIGSETSDMMSANKLLREYVLLTDDTLSFTGYEEERIRNQCVVLSRTWRSEVEALIMENQEKIKEVADELIEKTIIEFEK